MDMLSLYAVKRAEKRNNKIIMARITTISSKNSMSDLVYNNKPPQMTP